jgi:anthranilate synthase component 1
MSSTSQADFVTRLDEAHRVVPVIRELFADGETPVGIYRKLAMGKPGTFLLESAEQGGIWSRYSFVGVRSFGVLTQLEDAAVWLDYGLSESRALGESAPAAPLEALRHLYERWATPHVAGHPPLTGGLVGFIGWEAVRQLEYLPNIPPADFSVPGQAMSFVSELVVIDHRTGSVLLIVAALNDGLDDADALWSDAQNRLDTMQAELGKPSEAWIAEVDMSAEATPIPRVDPAHYADAIEKSKKYIRDGDVFQVVVSQRFDHEITLHVPALAGRLRGRTVLDCWVVTRGAGEGHREAGRDASHRGLPPAGRLARG